MSSSSSALFRWMLNGLLPVLVLSFSVSSFESVSADEEVEEPATNPPIDDEIDDLPLTLVQPTQLNAQPQSPNFLRTADSTNIRLAEQRSGWKVYRFTDYVVFVPSTLTSGPQYRDKLKSVIASMVALRADETRQMLVIQAIKPTLDAQWLPETDAAEMSEKYAKLIKSADSLN